MAQAVSRGCWRSYLSLPTGDRQAGSTARLPSGSGRHRASHSCSQLTPPSDQREGSGAAHSRYRRHSVTDRGKAGTSHHGTATPPPTAVRRAAATGADYGGRHVLGGGGGGGDVRPGWAGRGQPPAGPLLGPTRNRDRHGPDARDET